MIVALSVVGLLAAACYPGGQSSMAGDAARSFITAMQQRDSQRACGLLSREATASLQTGGRSCEQALADLDPPSGAVERVDVWADRAQVTSTDDTLFLVRLQEGWRVAAAGCRPRRDQPYECEVEA
jgi:hypothetical protein